MFVGGHRPLRTLAGFAKILFLCSRFLPEPAEQLVRAARVQAARSMADGLSHSYPRDAPPRLRDVDVPACEGLSWSDTPNLNHNFLRMARLWQDASRRPIIALPTIEVSTVRIEDFVRTYVMVRLNPLGLTMADPFLRPSMLHCTLVMSDTELGHFKDELQNSLAATLTAYTGNERVEIQLCRFAASKKSWVFGLEGEGLVLMEFLRDVAVRLLRQRRFFTTVRDLHVSWL